MAREPARTRARFEWAGPRVLDVNEFLALVGVPEPFGDSEPPEIVVAVADGSSVSRLLRRDSRQA